MVFLLTNSKVGLYWLVRRCNTRSQYNSYSYTLSMMCIVYTFLSFARTVTQERIYALIDQWMTLPFFGVPIIWGWRVLGRIQSRFVVVLLLTFSCTAYFMFAPFHRKGFEVAILIHITMAFAALVEALMLGRSYASMFCTSNPLVIPAIKWLACLFGFVFLKVYDHELATIEVQGMKPFQTLTGHFWHKIADFMQLYAAQAFLDSLERVKAGINKKRGN